jgi:hypothetical protein
MTYKHIIFYSHPLTDEGVARNLAVLAYSCILLYLDEGPYLGVIPNGTPIKIDKFGELYILSEPDIL